MKCVICTLSETVDGLTSITFERGEFRLVINNVPARVCPSCGESYVGEDVALRLLNDAENVSSQGVIEDIIEYGQ
ncbi:MAG: type II toxin-antitoxin system MqsA family antitoxin [Anaerolineales bacterium]|nr:type II toxin-antitoxin system MqsA family antitoxin [Anaerolineales bacterium]